MRTRSFKIYLSKETVGIRFKKKEKSFLLWRKIGRDWAVFCTVPCEGCVIRPLLGIIHPQKPNFFTRKDDLFLFKIGLFGKWYEVYKD